MPVYYSTGHRIGQGYTYGPPPPLPGPESYAPPQPGYEGYPPPPPEYQTHARPTYEQQYYPPPTYYATPVYVYDPYGPPVHGWQEYGPFPGGQQDDEYSEEEGEEVDTGEWWPPLPPGIPPPPTWRDLERSRQPERQPAAYPPEPPPRETPTRQPQGRAPRGQGPPRPGADPSGHVDWVTLKVLNGNEALDDLANGRRIRGINISVPQDRTVNRIIERLNGGAGWRLVEVSQLGNGRWMEDRSIEHGSPEAAMRIEDLGWTRARNGTEAPPVWVVLCRVRR